MRVRFYIYIGINYTIDNEVKFLLRFPENGEYYFTIYTNDELSAEIAGDVAPANQPISTEKENLIHLTCILTF